MPTEEPSTELVPTGVAAKALGIAHSTLHRWWTQGVVTPALITAGGHARWNIEDLREQLRRMRSSDQPS